MPFNLEKLAFINISGTDQRELLSMEHEYGNTCVCGIAKPNHPSLLERKVERLILASLILNFRRQQKTKKEG